MNIKAEKKMRIQAYHYRDGMLVKDIAKEVGISQAIVRKYLASVDEQLASGEIKREDIISSCDALGIDRPKKVRKQEVDEILSDQGVTQQQLSENVKALDETLAKSGKSDGGKKMAIPIKKQRRGGRQRQIVEIDGEPANKKMKERSPELDIITKYMSKSLLVLDDITKILDASAELKNCGYTAEEIVLALTGDTDSENKQPTSQREFVLGILGYLYDDLVAGNIKLSHYIMENGMHQLQFTEVEDDHSNRTGR
jgi:predicted transcriptional regulator